MKKQLKKLEKRLSYLSVQKNDRRQRKGGSSTKRRRKSKILKMIKETEDSGDDTEIIASDSETPKTQGECAHCSDMETPCLKRENAFYGVLLQSNLKY